MGKLFECMYGRRRHINKKNITESIFYLIDSLTRLVDPEYLEFSDNSIFFIGFFEIFQFQHTNEILTVFSLSLNINI